MQPRRSHSSSIGEISDDEALNMNQIEVPDPAAKSQERVSGVVYLNHMSSMQNEERM